VIAAKDWPPWSEAEEQELRRLVAADVPRTEIASRLGRTRAAVSNRISRARYLGEDLLSPSERRRIHDREAERAAWATERALKERS